MLQMDVMAKRLKAARLACGLTQRKASAKAGITRSTLARAELGYTIPGTFAIAALADAYGVSMDWLLGRDVGEMVIFFHTVEQLSALTGLSYDALWEAGFNLDDWDWGFVACHEWDDDWDRPDYERRLITMMDNYCVGYEHVEYNGRHYYMQYHA